MKTLKRDVAANRFELQRGTDTKMVQLLPAGKIVGRDGREWINSDPNAIIDYCRRLERDIPIDVEHSSEHKAPKGDPAPAMGWIKPETLLIRNGEIWGEAEWNTEGQHLVDDKSYRYLSPVILYAPKSGIIVGITSVGLTNQPNFRLPALNHQQGETPEEETMWKALLAALGLPESATEADAIAKVTGIKSELSQALNRAETPDLAKFVPRADYDAAKEKAENAEQQLSDLKKQQLEDEIDLAINQALEDGKITPATKEYHVAQCRQEGGLDRFKEYCKTAPKIADDSGLGKKTPDDKKTALNAEEQQIADMFGNSAEDLKKYASA